MAPLVTVSAAYGAGGSLVGPRLATRLDVPFLDRAIPVSVADHLEVPRQGLIKQQVPRDLFRRWVPAFAPATHRFAATASRNDPTHMTEEQFRRETEQVLHEYSESGAVILGRAAAVVLRDEPGALHVRLDGPPDRRIGQAMIVLGVDRPTAERELKIADRARETYVKRWYGVDPHDSRIYDLVIDSTRIRVDACVDLIEFAVHHARRPRGLTGGGGRPATPTGTNAQNPV